MEMPEIWQEVCLAFASWPEVVGLWFGTQKNTKHYEHFDTHDFNPSVSPYNNANGFKICHHLPKS